MRSYPTVPRILLPLLLLCVVLLAACGQGSQPTAQTNPTPTATSAPVMDAYGTPIVFPTTAPQRIVSLVPNTSEILAALGLESKIVGVDFYTNYPTSLSSKTKVSDASAKYNVEQIVWLKPDLVLTYGGNTKLYDGQLKNLGLKVIALPLANFTQALELVPLVGRITFTQDVATKLYNELQQQVKEIKSTVAGTTAPKVMIELDYSTPGKPYVFGGGSFGDEMLQDANATNVFASNTGGLGYPQVTDEAVISANPQFLILTEDPKYGGGPDAVYKRASWGNIEAIKMKHVYNVNADIMSRPGPRLVQGLRCVAQLVHPDKFSTPLPDYCAAAA